MTISVQKKKNPHTETNCFIFNYSFCHCELPMFFFRVNSKVFKSEIR